MVSGRLNHNNIKGYRVHKKVGPLLKGFTNEEIIKIGNQYVEWLEQHMSAYYKDKDLIESIGTIE